MLNARNRAEHYRNVAEECRRLAAIEASTDFRNQYLRMAERYSALAAADELRIQARVNGD